MTRAPALPYRGSALGSRGSGTFCTGARGSLASIGLGTFCTGARGHTGAEPPCVYFLPWFFTASMDAAAASGSR